MSDALWIKIIGTIPAVLWVAFSVTVYASLRVLADDSADLNDDLRQLGHEQEQLGIETRVLVRTQLPQNVRRGLVDEFIVFDKATCYEIEQDQLHVDTSTRVGTHEDYVGLRTQRFAELWDVGVPTQTVGAPTGEPGAVGA
jgi:hypothetical protein